MESARHLSSRFSLVIITFELCTDTFVEVPATFSLETPSTKRRRLFVSTVVTFPSMPAKSPLRIFTVSPLRTGFVRRRCVVRSSSDSGADRSLRTRWAGVSNNLFLCLEGLMVSDTCFPYHMMMLARFATRGHLSAASFATGPRISVPFSSPSGVIITAALSWKDSRLPSGRLKVFL